VFIVSTSKGLKLTNSSIVEVILPMRFIEYETLASLRKKHNEPFDVMKVISPFENFFLGFS
jgi:hypothetical protein